MYLKIKNLHVFSTAGMIVPAEIYTPTTATCCVLTECLQEVVPWVSCVSHGINSFWFTPNQYDMGCKITCCACQDVILKHILPSFHFLLPFTFRLAAVSKVLPRPPPFLMSTCTHLNRNDLNFLKVKVVLVLRNEEAREPRSLPSSYCSQSCWMVALLLWLLPHQLQPGGTCSTTTPNTGDEGALNHLPLLVGLGLEALSFPAEVAKFSGCKVHGADVTRQRQYHTCN